MIDGPMSSDTFVQRDVLEKLSGPEIRAIATDRGYDIPDNVTDRVLRVKFEYAQQRDHSLVIR